MSARVDNKGRKLPNNIYQRKDGRYQVRITVQGKQNTVYCCDLNEAKVELRKMQEDAYKGSLTQLKSLTLNEWYDKWILTYKKGKLKQRTYNNYINYYNKNIRNTKLGKMKLHSIKQIHMVQVYKDLAERKKKPLAQSTVRYINTMLGSCFHQAIANGLIATNPALGAMMNVNGRKEKKRFALTKRQEQQFLEYISQGRYAIYYPMFKILFRTGLRSGELRALTWKDVDYKDKKIIINKSVNYDILDGSVKREMYITSPKTESSIRTLPIINDVVEAFKQQQELQQLLEIRKDYSIKRFDDNNKVIGMCSDFVFTTSKGTIATEESLNRTIKAIIKDYNNKEEKRAKLVKREPELLPNFTMHCTRHTYATRAYEIDMKGPSISRSLGHRNEVVTKSIYTHVSPEILRRDLQDAWENRANSY